MYSMVAGLEMVQTNRVRLDGISSVGEREPTQDGLLRWWSGDGSHQQQLDNHIVRGRRELCRPYGIRHYFRSVNIVFRIM